MKRDTLEEIIATISFVLGVITLALVFINCMPHKEKTSIIYLKHPTAFANHSVITTKDDCDRVLNLRNISSVRKIEDKRLEVDGKMVILFKDSAEREMFISENIGK